jgi:hypothetical protein
VIRFPLQARRVAAATALALAAFPAAGCGGDPPSAGGPTPPASPSAPASLPTGGLYEVVDTMCPHVNLDPLTAIVPVVTEGPEEVEVQFDSIRTCSAVLGVTDDEDAQAIFTVSLEVYADSTEADDAYQTFYDNNIALSEGTTEVSGFGQKAFQCVNPAFDGMPLVRVLDGNANIATAFSYGVVQDGLPSEEALFEAMFEITRATMASLQAS